MFSRRSLPIWLSAGLMLCLQSVHAQNAGEVSLSFVSFPKSAEPVKLKLWLGDGKLLDITAPSNWLSPPVKVASMSAWVVGDMADGPDGKPVFKEYGRAVAPASPEQIVLLIRKGKDNADGFALVALDSRADGFGAGKYLFLNAAKVDVGGVVGEEKFVIKPGSHVIVKPKVPNGEQTFHTSLFFRKDDEARPFFSTEWRVNDKARNLIFFYHDPETTHIKFHAIKDFIN